MNATGSAPSPRSRHTATVVDKKMYIMGGGDESSVYNDLYVLSFGITLSHYCIKITLFTRCY